MKQIKSWTAGPGSGGRRKHILLYSILTGIAILAAALSVAALLISGNKIKIEQCGLLANSLYGFSVCAACFLTARRSAQGKLLWSGLTALALCGITLGVIFSLPEASADALGRMLGITAAAWLIGGLVGARKKKHGYG